MKAKDIKLVQGLLHKREQLQNLKQMATTGSYPGRKDLSVTWKLAPYFSGGSPVDECRLLDVLQMDGPYMALVNQQIDSKLRKVETELRELGVELDPPMHVHV